MTKLPLETPVYMFLGFLESGKTKFIQETFEDPRFSSGEKTLLLVCEEGEVEDETIKFSNAESVDIAFIEDKADLTEENLTALQLKYGAERIVVEYNGMWELGEFFNAMPEGWMINQLMTFFDARTFVNYNANMRQLVFDKIQNTQLVVFNRFDSTMDKMAFHKIVRGINRPHLQKLGAVRQLQLFGLLRRGGNPVCFHLGNAGSVTAGINHIQKL